MGVATTLGREKEEGEGGPAGLGRCTVHLGPVQFRPFSFSFSILFQQQQFCNISSHQMTLYKCGAWPHKYYEIFCTATRSLGKFGIHLDFPKIEKAFIVLFWHCLKCLGPL